jgi:hypothetical protein
MSSTGVSLLAGDSLISFGEGISQALRADIMDCLLYAQPSADGRFDKRKFWQPWIEEFKSQLWRTGGQQTGAVIPRPKTINGLATLSSLRLDVLGAASSPQLQSLLKHSLDALMTGEHAQTFFNSWFSSGRSESFQVVPCESDGSGGATILVCGLQLTTKAVGSGLFPWQVLAGEMTVIANGAACRLTSQGYEPYRKSIQDYLKDQARKIVEL